MGTRGVTCVIKDNKFVVGQYGQWDHNPAGQGITVLSFVSELNNLNNLQTFKDQLDKCRFGTDEETEILFDTNDNARQFLTRDAGADILTLIANSKDNAIVLQDASNFVNESLMCEWVYVIDLDTNTLEVYEGFNKSPVPTTNRFQGEGYVPYDGCEEIYYPCVEVNRWPLDNLPTPDEFVKVLDPVDEDEDENIN